MSRIGEKLPIRRILVALDASPHSRAALQVAAELAARLRAELIGLFVEDVVLLRIGGLPCAREVESLSGTIRELDAWQLERQLRAMAGRMREAVASAAQRARINWGFQVARGTVASEVLAAAGDADLVILGKAGWSRPEPRRLGSTVRTILLEGPTMTLILQHGSGLARPVIALTDGTAWGDKALEVAFGLGRLQEQGLVILVLSPEEGERMKAAQVVERRCRQEGLSARVHLLPEVDLARLLQEIRNCGTGPLVIPCQGPLLSGASLERLVEELPNPVLLVR